MHKSIYWPLIVLGLVGALTACSEQPTREPLSREDAQELKSSLIEGNKYLVASLGNPSGAVSTTTVGGQALPGPVANLILASGLDAQNISCSVTTSPSSLQDQDGDGIPVLATFSVDCNVGNNSLKGKMTLQAKYTTKVEKHGQGHIGNEF